MKNLRQYIRNILLESSEDLRKELKQRNLVHLNAPRSGAGKHIDRKRQMKQGYQKHKGNMDG